MFITKTLSDSSKFIRQNPIVFIPGMVAAFIHSLVMIFTRPTLLNLYDTMLAHPGDFISRVNINSVIFVEFALFLSLIATFYSAIWIVSMCKNKKSPSYTASKSAMKFPVILVSTILFFFVVMVGLMVLVIPGIYLLVRLIFFPQAIMLENKDVFSSMRRSWDLTKNKSVDTFLTLLFIGVLLFVFGIPNAIIDNIVFNSLYSFVLMSVFTPFIFVSLTVYYKRLKKRW